jgi:hypothetical protein
VWHRRMQELAQPSPLDDVLTQGMQERQLRVAVHRLAGRASYWLDFTTLIAKEEKTHKSGSQRGLISTEANHDFA